MFWRQVMALNWVESRWYASCRSRIMLFRRKARTTRCSSTIPGVARFWVSDVWACGREPSGQAGLGPGCRTRHADDTGRPSSGFGSRVPRRQGDGVFSIVVRVDDADGAAELAQRYCARPPIPTAPRWRRLGTPRGPAQCGIRNAIDAAVHRSALTSDVPDRSGVAGLRPRAISPSAPCAERRHFVASALRSKIIECSMIMD